MKKKHKQREKVSPEKMYDKNHPSHTGTPKRRKRKKGKQCLEIAGAGILSSPRSEILSKERLKDKHNPDVQTIEENNNNDDDKTPKHRKQQKRKCLTEVEDTSTISGVFNALSSPQFDCWKKQQLHKKQKESRPLVHVQTDEENDVDQNTAHRKGKTRKHCNVLGDTLLSNDGDSRHLEGTDLGDYRKHSKKKHKKKQKLNRVEDGGSDVAAQIAKPSIVCMKSREQKCLTEYADGGSLYSADILTPSRKSTSETSKKKKKCKRRKEYSPEEINNENDKRQTQEHLTEAGDMHVLMLSDDSTLSSPRVDCPKSSKNKHKKQKEDRVLVHIQAAEKIDNQSPKHRKHKKRKHGLEGEDTTTLFHDISFSPPQSECLNSLKGTFEKESYPLERATKENDNNQPPKQRKHKKRRHGLEVEDASTLLDDVSSLSSPQGECPKSLKKRHKKQKEVVPLVKTAEENENNQALKHSKHKKQKHTEDASTLLDNLSSPQSEKEKQQKEYSSLAQTTEESENNQVQNHRKHKKRKHCVEVEDASTLSENLSSPQNGLSKSSKKKRKRQIYMIHNKKELFVTNHAKQSLNNGKQKKRTTRSDVFKVEPILVSDDTLNVNSFSESQSDFTGVLKKKHKTMKRDCERNFDWSPNIGDQDMRLQQHDGRTLGISAGDHRFQSGQSRGNNTVSIEREDNRDTLGISIPNFCPSPESDLRKKPHKKQKDKKRDRKRSNASVVRSTARAATPNSSVGNDDSIESSDISNGQQGVYILDIKCEIDADNVHVGDVTSEGSTDTRSSRSGRSHLATSSQIQKIPNASDWQPDHVGDGKNETENDIVGQATTGEVPTDMTHNIGRSDTIQTQWLVRKTDLFVSDEVDAKIHSVNVVNCKLDKSTRHRLEEEGIHLRKGIWVKAEDERLRENWNNILLHHPLDSPYDLLTSRRKKESVNRGQLNEYVKHTLFYQKLACGLNRTTYSCYVRARRLFHDKTAGSYTDEDFSMLVRLRQQYGNKWQLIGEKMDRTGKSLQDMYRWRVNKTSTGPWSVDEEEHLVQAIREVMGTIDLENLYYQIPWQQISLKVASRTGPQCRQHWLWNLCWKANNEGKRGRFDENDRVHLVGSIYMLEITEESEIDWDELFTDFEHAASPQNLQKQWFRLKTEVPTFHSKSFEDIREFLFKKWVLDGS